MPSLYQGYVLMAIFFCGLLYGIIYQPKTFLFNLTTNKVIRFILDFLYAILGGAIFWIGIFKSNLGIFRFFLLIVYLIGFLLVEFSCKKLVANMGKTMYNKINENKKLRQNKKSNN
ncbi:MAG: spore cortex biosynthesis protein YabQ [Clostridia bacterium]|nr:spore cortex biosynthesis protein YabQ [Clostridia bacterium]